VYAGVGHPLFSPDSRHLAYIACGSNDMFLVVDGVEGKHYDFVQEQTLRFDSAKSLRYMAVQGDEIYLVQEIIQ
jgi:hypothetical protein